MLTSLSVDEMLPPRYVNWSINLKCLPFNAEMVPSGLKRINSVSRPITFTACFWICIWDSVWAYYLKVKKKEECVKKIKTTQLHTRSNGMFQKECMCWISRRLFWIKLMFHSLFIFVTVNRAVFTKSFLSPPRISAKHLHVNS